MPEDQLSLAIGKDGQNARLAARVTSWRIEHQRGKRHWPGRFPLEHHVSVVEKGKKKFLIRLVKGEEGIEIDPTGKSRERILSLSLQGMYR